MPELPEVETIRLGLSKKIVGLTISKVQVSSPKSFTGNIKDIENKKVIGVWRRAKVLGIDFGSSLRTTVKQSSLDSPTTQIASSKTSRNDNGVTLLFHLKMTGQLIYDPSTSLRTSSRFIGGHPTPDMKDAMPNSHTRVIFEFSNGSKLYFNDQRRFGWVKVVKSEELRVQNFLQKLGPEPLEKGFTWQVLKENLLKHESQSVKVAIMDQAVVSGVGNIYASEGCFNAKIDPRTKIKELSDEQFKNLYQGVLKALRDGIKYGGSSKAHFVDADGHKGYFLDYAYVYGRDKHSCRKCGTDIKKITLGGRGTYFCESCQK